MVTATNKCFYINNLELVAKLLKSTWGATLPLGQSSDDSR